jgi:hypothetical protein
VALSHPQSDKEIHDDPVDDGTSTRQDCDMGMRFQRKLLMGGGSLLVPLPMAPPATVELGHRQITIEACNLRALACAILALIAYPSTGEEHRRDKAIAAFERFAALVDPQYWPQRVLRLPPVRDLARAILRPARRITTALALAVRLPFEPAAAAAMLAQIRTEKFPGHAPKRPHDVLTREIAPVMPGIHLAAAIVAGRGAFDGRDQPLPSEMRPHDVPQLRPEQRRGLAERQPKLAQPKLAQQLDLLLPALGLLFDTRWPFHVLVAAERWRQAIDRPELVEVRARWLPE